MMKSSLYHKVVYVAPFNLAVKDGTSIRVLNIARAASELFDEVLILSHYFNTYLVKNIFHVKLRAVPARYHYISAFGSFVSSQLNLRFAQYVLGIDLSDVRRLMRGADVIHVHWLLFTYLAKALNTISSGRTPIIVDLHGLFKLQNLPKGSLRDVLVHVLGLLYEHVGIRDKAIRAFTVPSVGLKWFIETTYKVDPDKVFVVPDAVEWDVINAAKQCDNILMEFVEKMKVICCNFHGYVAYVGSVSSYHGFFDLIRAIKLLRDHAVNIKLLLIVPGRKQLASIREELPEGTVILESIPRKYVPCILRGASALVLPHRAGTQFDYIPSNKIYDYMLAGRPIVAYRTITALETLKKYPMHILVKPNDPKSLADGIVKAIELWGNTNPSPEFNSIPTLNDVKEALIKVYNYVMNR